MGRRSARRQNKKRPASDADDYEDCDDDNFYRARNDRLTSLQISTGGILIVVSDVSMTRL
jgi:hypothetical protein